MAAVCGGEASTQRSSGSLKLFRVSSPPYRVADILHDAERQVPGTALCQQRCVCGVCVCVSVCVTRPPGEEQRSEGVQAGLVRCFQRSLHRSGLHEHVLSAGF